MAARKFLYNNNGVITEKAGVTTQTAYEIPVLDATGRLNILQMPTSVGPMTKSAVAYEGIDQGMFVHLCLDGGVLTAKKATASSSNALPAHGFVATSYTTGQTATIYLSGVNSYRTGLEIGTKYYLSSTTAGSVTTAASLPSGANAIIQYLGVGLSTSEIAFNPSDPIVLAA